MHPTIRRSLARLRQLDHVNGRRISALLAKPTFQRSLKFPDRGVTRAPNRIERNAGLRLAAMALDL